LNLFTFRDLFSRVFF